MKKWVPALLLVCVVLTGFYLLLNPAKISVPPLAEPTAPASPSGQKNAANIAAPPVATVAGSNLISAPAASRDLSARAGQVASPPAAAKNILPAMVVENVSRALRQYGAQFGGNPVGTNPEITAALNGGNPKQANFINPEAGMQVNGNGELVDAWDTPFFFHQLSGSETEVRSAGPDKIMWTPDDLVAK
jgi:hypothetical protein